MKRGLILALGSLSFLTGGFPAGADSGLEGPRLLQPLLVSIPQGIEHLVEESDTATIELRIGKDGRVVDWVALELPHYKLAGPLDRALQEARFQPAMENGEPVQIDLVGLVDIGQGDRIGVRSISVTEALQGRLGAVGVHPYRMVLCPAEKLDQPLQIQERDPARAVRSESGEVLTGEVWVEFYIDQNGEPRMIRPEKSDRPALEQAAMMAVEGFRFHPPRRSGTPVVVKARILVVFA